MGHKHRSVRNPVERFWESVDKRGPDECWRWTRATLPSGYGLFKARSYVQVYAHRYSYELSCGPIPDGMHIDHLCENKTCVNPFHLEVVTREENTKRWNLRRTLCRNGLHDITVPGAIAIVGKDKRRICRACRSANLERKRIRQRPPR